MNYQRPQQFWTDNRVAAMAWPNSVPRAAGSPILKLLCTRARREVPGD